jgi:hypothetical protein
MTKIIRDQDFDALAGIATERGFREMFKNIILSKDDPRIKLLHFNSNDFMKVTVTNLSVAEKESEKFQIIQFFLFKLYIFRHNRL